MRYKKGDIIPELRVTTSKGESLTIARCRRKGPGLLAARHARNADRVVIFACERTGHRDVLSWRLVSVLRSAASRVPDGAPEIHRLGAELVAISAQTADYALGCREEAAPTRCYTTRTTVSRGSTAWVFALNDAMKGLHTNAFERPIPKFNGDDSWELARPGTFVLDRTGIVGLAHVDPNCLSACSPSYLANAYTKGPYRRHDQLRYQGDQTRLPPT